MLTLITALSFVLATETATSASIVKPFKPDSNTVVLLHLDENDENTFVDASGNQNHGAPQAPGSAPMGDGKFGDGLDHGRISTPIAGFNSVAGTAELWVNFSSLEGRQVLWQVYGPTSDGLLLEIKEKDDAGNTVRIIDFVAYSRASKRNLHLKAPYDDLLRVDTWHHLALVWETVDNKLSVGLLVDGKTAAVGDFPLVLNITADRQHLGAQHNGDLKFQGVFDEFRLSTLRRYEALPELTTVPIDKRKKVTDRTHFISRIQSQYNLYRNYLNNHYEQKWIDRPLYYDRTLWQGLEKNFESYKTSVQRTTDIFKSYGLDVMGNLTGATEFVVKSRTLLYDAFDQLPTGDVTIALEISGGFTASLDTCVAEYGKFIDRALKCPAAFRLGGQVAVLSYCADADKPEKLAEGLRLLRAAKGRSFVFIADIRTPRGVELDSWPAFEKAFIRYDGRLPVAEVEALKKYLRSYLDVCDGLMFAGANHLCDDNNHFHEKFYREFLIPVFAAVLSEPPYRKKYSGLSASVGYVNHFSGVVKLHDGTRNLRQSFEAALGGNPDFITMPEWNEPNENTFFQPSINSSLSSQKIIRHYIRQSRGLPPLSNPGDNSKMPDLVVSSQRALRAGEELFIELLNVPSAGYTEAYSVTIRLLDENGSMVHQFPSQPFMAKNLEEKRLFLGAEKIAGCRAVYPQVDILTSTGQKFSFNEGLFAMRIRPTWNWNYASVRQTLQDVVPLESSFKVRMEGGRAVFSGLFRSTEQIATAEILEDETEVYAVDPAGEYRLHSNEALVQISWNARPNLDQASAEVQIFVQQGTIRYLENKHRGIDVFFEEPLIRTGPASARMPYYRQNNTRKRGGFFIISGKNQARITVKVPNINAEYSIPVKEIEAAGVFVRQFNDKGFLLRFEIPNRLIDIPMVNKNEIRFETALTPLNSNSMFHLQIVTAGGKIFRSRPLAVPMTDTRPPRPLTVFTGINNETKIVSVAPGLIPDISYRFTPEHGNALVNCYGANWNAELGGGLAYCGLFSGGGTPPPRIDLPGPLWINRDGADCLQFNGINNYIHFPHDVLPCQAGFVLSFEIFPTAEKSQLLLRTKTSLKCRLEGGKIELTVTDRELNTSTFKTDTEVPINKWSRVVITFTPGQGFKIAVNERSSALQVFKSRFNELYSQLTFGGYGTGKDYFEGYLRSFRVQHGSLQ